MSRRAARFRCFRRGAAGSWAADGGRVQEPLTGLEELDACFQLPQEHMGVDPQAGAAAVGAGGHWAVWGEPFRRLGGYHGVSARGEAANAARPSRRSTRERQFGAQRGGGTETHGGPSGTHSTGHTQRTSTHTYNTVESACTHGIGRTHEHAHTTDRRHARHRTPQRTRVTPNRQAQWGPPKRTERGSKRPTGRLTNGCDIIQTAREPQVILHSMSRTVMARSNTRAERHTPVPFRSAGAPSAGAPHGTGAHGRFRRGMESDWEALPVRNFPSGAAAWGAQSAPRQWGGGRADRWEPRGSPPMLGGARRRRADKGGQRQGRSLTSASRVPPC